MVTAHGSNVPSKPYAVSAKAKAAPQLRVTPHDSEVKTPGGCPVSSAMAPCACPELRRGHEQEESPVVS